jgi:putative transposase
VVSVVSAAGSSESGSLIDEIFRKGARWMLAAALGAAVNQCVVVARGEAAA